MTTRRGRIQPLLLLAPFAAAPGGCFTPPEGFESTDPSGRISAASHAAEEDDATAVPEIVGMLSSDDPAERMVAIASLERLTGQRLGYEPTASLVSRRTAVDRWRAWLEKNPAGPSTPGGAAPVGPATVPAPRTDR